MRPALILTAGFIPFWFTTGCQKSSTPPPAAVRAPPPAAVDQPVPVRANADTGDAPDEAEQAGADEPDDPGRTTARDKTAQQEEPSGDESSRAAPNDGDAEPPQAIPIRRP